MIMGTKPISLKKLAEKLNLKFTGNGDLLITHVSGLDSLAPGGLAYLTDPNGLSSVPTPAGMNKQNKTTLDEINSSQIALIVDLDVFHHDHNLILSPDPLETHVAATKFFNTIENIIPELTKKLKIHPSAFVSKRAKLDKNVFIGPKATIYDGVSI